MFLLFYFVYFSSFVSISYITNSSSIHIFMSLMALTVCYGIYVMFTNVT